MTRWTVPVAVLLVAGVGCSSAAPTPIAPAPTTATPTTANAAATATELNGSGATFIQPIMKFWTEEFAEKTGGQVKVNYQGGGSGAGVDQLTKKLTAFGCSDAPMTQSQTDAAAAAGGPVVHIPLVIGAVVPMYNLAGVPNLTFTGPVLADIYLGKITRWNDPALAKLNPGVALPDTAIQPVVRADTSGTTFIFTDYLSSVSDEFKTKVGASTSAKFPVGIAQNKSDGVAGHVARTPGAIGYIELTYALDKKSAYGAVVNKAGKPIKADLPSITAAAAASLGSKPTQAPYSLHDLTYRLIDATGDQSYPIAAMSFGLLYQRQAGAKGKAVVDFFRWAASAEGQAMAQKRNFAPLPPELQKKIAEKLNSIEVGN